MNNNEEKIISNEKKKTNFFLMSINYDNKLQMIYAFICDKYLGGNFQCKI